jgi:hypothetical protein
MYLSTAGMTPAAPLVGEVTMRLQKHNNQTQRKKGGDKNKPATRIYFVYSDGVT